MKTIFFIEDNQNLGLIWRLLFERNGYSVKVFESGEEVLESLTNLPTPNVIISDFNLPGINGAELLKKMCLIHPEVVPIILTGDKELVEASEEVDHRFLIVGKPVQFEVIKNLLEDEYNKLNNYGREANL